MPVVSPLDFHIHTGTGADPEILKGGGGGARLHDGLIGWCAKHAQARGVWVRVILKNKTSETASEAT